MSEPFFIQILGNVETRRTEAEIYIAVPDQDAQELWAILYESRDGWRVNFFGDSEVRELPYGSGPRRAEGCAREALALCPPSWRQGSDRPD